MFSAGLNQHNSLEFIRSTQFTLTTHVSWGLSSALQWRYVCLHCLWIRFYAIRIQLNFFAKLKKIGSSPFKCLDFLLKFSTTAPDSSLQLRSALQIAFILICSRMRWTREALVLIICIVVLFISYYSTIISIIFGYLPALHQIMWLTLVKCNSCSLIFSAERKLGLFAYVTCAHSFVLLFKKKVFKIIEKIMLKVGNQL